MRKKQRGEKQRRETAKMESEEKSRVPQSSPEEGPEEGMPLALKAEFRVLYEDDDIMVVDKAAPLLMHPTGKKQEPTLLHGLQALLVYELACGGQVSLINRLDRETSGIVLVAKNAVAAGELGKSMQQHHMRKTYQAIVLGCPAWDSAYCAEPILRMEEIATTRVHVRQCCHPAGKPCQTAFRVLQRIPARRHLPGMSLVECTPETGRMHQIRVHLAHLGYPIVGDKIYGGDERCYLEFITTGWNESLAERLYLNRHALHACRLEFPWRGRILRIESELPEDMAALLS